MSNRISSEKWPDFREPKPGELFIDLQAVENDYQAAYLSGYAASEARYSGDRIRAALCYVSLISGLVGFIVGALIAGMP